MRKGCCFSFVLFCLALCLPLHAQDAESDNIELLSTLAPQGVDAYYTDIWGYVDDDGREYAIMGQRHGTTIIDVSDPRNPVEVGYIEGAQSNWRDMKVYRHYAYVVHDANDNGYDEPGLQIIDLSPLPENPPVLVKTYSENMGPGTSHNIGLTDGIAYMVGTKTFPAVIVLDLRQDPENPVEINTIREPYWHDVIVHNDVVFASAINARYIQILDGSDPTDLVELSRTTYPGAFTHNIANSEDNAYIISTDEVHGRPLNFWNTSDLTDPQWQASFQMPGRAVAHNAYIKGDYAYIAYYYDGLKILDIADRGTPVEVAHYDTYPDDNLQRGSGFRGAWGCYPYMPSGNILVSDIKYGLFVFRFNDTRAGYIRGEIYDAETNERLKDVEIQMLDRPGYEGVTSTRSGQGGSYAVGSKTGSRRLSFFLYGYEELVLDDVEFVEGETVNRDIPLQPIPTAGVLVSVMTTKGEAVSNQKVNIFSNVYEFAISPSTDVKGEIRRTMIFDSYTIALDTWGFLPEEQQFVLDQPELKRVDLTLQRGYFEDFDNPVDWSLWSPDDSTNFWHAVRAKDQGFIGILPERDVEGNDDGVYIYSKAQRGAAVLTSRVFDATVIEQPVLEFYRYFNPRQFEKDENADDSLQVYVSNDSGKSWVLVDTYSEIDSYWHKLQYWLSDYVAPSEHMQVRFVHVEGDRENRPSIRYRRPSYCALDDFTIIPDAITSVEGGEVVPPQHLSVLVYPNPAANTVNISWLSVNGGDFELRLSDILGRVVLSKSFRQRAPGEQTVEIPLEGLQAGVYSIQFKESGSAYSSQQLIISR